MARVRALLLRGHVRQALAASESPLAPVAYRHINLDPAGRRVLVVQQEVDLTFNEFELLYVLVDHENGGVLRIEPSASQQKPTTSSARPPR